MKAVILAGGLGSRLSEETELKPKPMVEIGGRPILWHIMKLYSHHGINDFIICCGYKGHLIKQYFAEYFIHTCDVTFELSSNRMRVHSVRSEPWTVTLVDTGQETDTGGRLCRVKNYLAKEDIFHFTYGDGLADVNLNLLAKHHAAANVVASLSSVMPPGRFGALQIEGNLVTKFLEKPSGEQGTINGGFMMLTSKIFEYLNDSCSFEGYVLPRLAADRNLSAYPHKGFWQPMDTLRDRRYLEHLWVSGKAPWKLWNDNLTGIEEKLVDLMRTAVSPPK